MKTEFRFEGLIAPCGMNCGVCIGYLRDRNPCSGCNEKSDNKPKHCINCAIVNCSHLRATESGYCSECEIYPCARLKRLDKRYREKYRMSMTENLDTIKKLGENAFLETEQNRWNCTQCAEPVSVHRLECSNCGQKVNSQTI